MASGRLDCAIHSAQPNLVVITFVKPTVNTTTATPKIENHNLPIIDVKAMSLLPLNGHQAQFQRT